MWRRCFVVTSDERPRGTRRALMAPAPSAPDTSGRPCPALLDFRPFALALGGWRGLRPALSLPVSHVVTGRPFRPSCSALATLASVPAGIGRAGPPKPSLWPAHGPAGRSRPPPHPRPWLASGDPSGPRPVPPQGAHPSPLSHPPPSLRRNLAGAFGRGVFPRVALPPPSGSGRHPPLDACPHRCRRDDAPP